MEWRIRQKGDNNLPQNGEIIRYDKVIGYTVRDVVKGNWIDKSTVTLPKVPPLNPPSRATKVPGPLPLLGDYTFEDYRSAGGSVGTKNLLGITTSVHCIADVMNYVVRTIERGLLPKYSSIGGIVDLNHPCGYGVAINVPTAVVPIHTVHNIVLNPNFGGEVIVAGLGCEKLQPQRLQKGTENVQSIPVGRVNIVRLQDEQRVGPKSMVDDTLQATAYRLEKFNQASASPARPPNWQWIYTAVTATRSPALPLTPLLATPLTYWRAAAQR